MLIIPCWRELIARAYHNSLYNQYAPRWRELVARAYHNSLYNPAGASLQLVPNSKIKILPRWRELVARAYHNSLYNQCPRWRELVARAYHNSLYNQCAPPFSKLSEFDKVLSFGASRTGFYPSLILRSTFAQPSPAGASL